MKLQFFKEEAYEELYGSINHNCNRYSNEKQWVSDYFEGSNYEGVSSVEVKNVRLSKGSAPELDIHNVKLLYGGYMNLSPLMATNKYLWSHLAHKEHYQYVVSRWMSSPGINTIRTRFFVEGRSGLTDNAISRLWWYGYLTYDTANAKTNPWHLTEVLLTSQQICTDLLDEGYSRNKLITRGMLRALKKIIDDYPECGLSTIWRQCVKYINQYGGIKNLDYLGENEIFIVAGDFMKRRLEQAGEKKDAE